MFSDKAALDELAIELGERGRDSAALARLLRKRYSRIRALRLTVQSSASPVYLVAGAEAVASALGSNSRLRLHSLVLSASKHVAVGDDAIGDSLVSKQQFVAHLNGRKAFGVGHPTSSTSGAAYGSTEDASGTSIHAGVVEAVVRIATSCQASLEQLVLPLNTLESSGGRRMPVVSVAPGRLRRSLLGPWMLGPKMIELSLAGQSDSLAVAQHGPHPSTLQLEDLFALLGAPSNAVATSLPPTHLSRCCPLLRCLTLRVDAAPSTVDLTGMAPVVALALPQSLTHLSIMLEVSSAAPQDVGALLGAVGLALCADADAAEAGCEAEWQTVCDDDSGAAESGVEGMAAADDAAGPGAAAVRNSGLGGGSGDAHDAAADAASRLSDEAQETMHVVDVRRCVARWVSEAASLAARLRRSGVAATASRLHSLGLGFDAPMVLPEASTRLWNAAIDWAEPIAEVPGTIADGNPQHGLVERVGPFALACAITPAVLRGAVSGAGPYAAAASFQALSLRAGCADHKLQAVTGAAALLAAAARGATAHATGRVRTGDGFVPAADVTGRSSVTWRNIQPPDPRTAGTDMGSSATSTSDGAPTRLKRLIVQGATVTASMPLLPPELRRDVLVPVTAGSAASARVAIGNEAVAAEHVSATLTMWQCLAHFGMTAADAADCRAATSCAWSAPSAMEAELLFQGVRPGLESLELLRCPKLPSELLGDDQMADGKSRTALPTLAGVGSTLKHLQFAGCSFDPTATVQATTTLLAGLTEQRAEQGAGAVGEISALREAAIAICRRVLRSSNGAMTLARALLACTGLESIDVCMQELQLSSSSAHWRVAATDDGAGLATTQQDGVDGLDLRIGEGPNGDEDQELGQGQESDEQTEDAAAVEAWTAGRRISSAASTGHTTAPRAADITGCIAICQALGALPGLRGVGLRGTPFAALTTCSHHTVGAVTPRPEANDRGVAGSCPSDSELATAMLSLLATPSGKRKTTMLRELRLPYHPHLGQKTTKSLLAAFVPAVHKATATSTQTNAAQPCGLTYLDLRWAGGVRGVCWGHLATLVRSGILSNGVLDLRGCITRMHLGREVGDTILAGCDSDLVARIERATAQATEDAGRVLPGSEVWVPMCGHLAHGVVLSVSPSAGTAKLFSARTMPTFTTTSTTVSGLLSPAIRSCLPGAAVWVGVVLRRLLIAMGMRYADLRTATPGLVAALLQGLLLGTGPMRSKDAFAKACETAMVDGQGADAFEERCLEDATAALVGCSARLGTNADGTLGRPGDLVMCLDPISDGKVLTGDEDAMAATLAGSSSGLVALAATPRGRQLCGVLEIVDGTDPVVEAAVSPWRPSMLQTLDPGTGTAGYVPLTWVRPVALADPPHDGTLGDDDEAFPFHLARLQGTVEEREAAHAAFVLTAATVEQRNIDGTISIVEVAEKPMRVGPFSSTHGPRVLARAVPGGTLPLIDAAAAAAEAATLAEVRELDPFRLFRVTNPEALGVFAELPHLFEQATLSARHRLLGVATSDSVAATADEDSKEQDEEAVGGEQEGKVGMAEDVVDEFCRGDRVWAPLMPEVPGTPYGEAVVMRVVGQVHSFGQEATARAAWVSPLSGPGRQLLVREDMLWRADPDDLALVEAAAFCRLRAAGTTLTRNVSGTLVSAGFAEPRSLAVGGGAESYPFRSERLFKQCRAGAFVAELPAAAGVHDPETNASLLLPNGWLSTPQDVTNAASRLANRVEELARTDRDTEGASLLSSTALRVASARSLRVLEARMTRREGSESAMQILSITQEIAVADAVKGALEAASSFAPERAALPSARGMSLVLAADAGVPIADIPAAFLLASDAEFPGLRRLPVDDFPLASECSAKGSGASSAAAAASGMPLPPLLPGMCVLVQASDSMPVVFVPAVIARVSGGCCEADAQVELTGIDAEIDKLVTTCGKGRLVGRTALRVLWEQSRASLREFAMAGISLQASGRDWSNASEVTTRRHARKASDRASALLLRLSSLTRADMQRLRLPPPVPVAGSVEVGAAVDVCLTERLHGEWLAATVVECSGAGRCMSVTVSLDTLSPAGESVVMTVPGHRVRIRGASQPVVLLRCRSTLPMSDVLPPGTSGIEALMPVGGDGGGSKAWIATTIVKYETEAGSDDSAGSSEQAKRCIVATEGEPMAVDLWDIRVAGVREPAMLLSPAEQVRRGLAVAPPVLVLPAGTRVQGRWRQYGTWYRARLGRPGPIHGGVPTGYEMHYDDGDHEAFLASEFIRLEGGDVPLTEVAGGDFALREPEEEGDYHCAVPIRGQHVMGRWRGGRVAYPGRVVDVTIDAGGGAAVDIDYGDGDVDSLLRLCLVALPSTVPQQGCSPFAHGGCAAERDMARAFWHHEAARLRLLPTRLCVGRGATERRDQADSVWLQRSSLGAGMGLSASLTMPAQRLRGLPEGRLCRLGDFVWVAGADADQALPAVVTGRRPAGRWCAVAVPVKAATAEGGEGSRKSSGARLRLEVHPEAVIEALTTAPEQRDSATVDLLLAQALADAARVGVGPHQLRLSYDETSSRGLCRLATRSEVRFEFRMTSGGVGVDQCALPAAPAMPMPSPPSGRLGSLCGQRLALDPSLQKSPRHPSATISAVPWLLPSQASPRNKARACHPHELLREMTLVVESGACAVRRARLCALALEEVGEVRESTGARAESGDGAAAVLRASASARKCYETRLIRQASGSVQQARIVHIGLADPGTASEEFPRLYDAVGSALAARQLAATEVPSAAATSGSVLLTGPTQLALLPIPLRLPMAVQP